MKKFMWKEFIKKTGGKKKFITFIILTILTIATIIWVIYDIGISIVIESIVLSILIDMIKEYIKALKETDEYFSIKK